MAGNDDLHPLLSAISETLGALRQDVQTLTGEVRKIPAAIEEAATTVRDAIHENIQAQAELKVMEHVVEVKSIVPQIRAEQTRIETERSELEDRLEDIGERYERKHAELDRKASERIRDLGEHIFEIQETQFEAGIEKPFTEHVTTTWDQLRVHNERVGETRRTEVEETTGDLVESIHGFIDRQEALLDEIDAHRLDLGLEIEDPTRIQLPYYVVELERDGRRERHVVPPARLAGSDDGRTTLETFPGLESLVDATPLRDPTESAMSRSSLVSSLDAYLDRDGLLVSSDEELEKLLPEQVPVRIEGGES